MCSHIYRAVQHDCSLCGFHVTRLSMNMGEHDVLWMKEAIKLASNGIGLTSPNPCVGAVIVYKDQIIGSGFHEKSGLPHAERNAIADGISRGNIDLFKDSTLYVTLEPCSTTGKTPPCTDAILEHHFKRVVYGSEDPNPKHRGVAECILKQAGIQVTRGVLKKECDFLIKSFRINMLECRPWVIAKSAMSLDGRISRSLKRSQWLTNEKSRSFVHTLRAECDAILTGGNTIRLDDPSFTIRDPDRPISPLKEQPWRIILTRHIDSIPINSVCLTDRYRDRTIIVEDVVNYLELLKKLYNDRKISTILLEAGGNLVREFLNARLVDEWVGFYAPIITGGGADGVKSGMFFEREAWLKDTFVRTFGNDVCIRGEVIYK